MSKLFVRSGNIISVRDKTTMETYDDLPVGTYTVKFNEQQGEFYLEGIDDFALPDKIYGSNNTYSTRILNTFKDRPGSTGVMLSGVKGAGKTLLAKQTAVNGAAIGIPTIVINRNWYGDEFNSFIQSITTPSIILFDEFEKIYDYQEQRKILTLLDGVFNSQKLFIVTTNVEREVSEYMQNRPGRIFYNFKFDTLEADFIQEYLEDRLDDKTQIDSILKYTNIFSFFNFDMLSAATEEMNRYGESLQEVLDVLNIQPENRQTDTHSVSVILGGKEYQLDRNYRNFQPNQFEYIVWTDADMSPAIAKDSNAVTLANLLSEPDSPTSGNDDRIVFNPSLIKRFDAVDNRFVYGIEHNGVEAELHIKRNSQMDKWAYNPAAF